MPMCSSKEAQLSDLIDIIIEKLEMGGTVTFTPHGESMKPMLRDGEDVVVLKKPNGRLKLYDIPLYRRKDGSFVLHRVIDFDNDGSYVMCGDNQFRREHGIKDSDVIAVVTAFCRKGTPFTMDAIFYRLYVSVWYNTRPFRRAFRGVKRGFIKVFNITPKEEKEKQKTAENTDNTVN